MARIFCECVILRSPESGEPVVFLPGSPVPGWAESLVTNPAVTVDTPDEESTVTDKDTDKGEADSVSGSDSKAEDITALPLIAARPYGNATKNEWVDYADGLGVIIPDGATKGDVIALVDALPSAE